MHLIIDGYNLLHAGHPLRPTEQGDLQQEREQLIDQLASYRRTRPCEITVVFDGWKEGWITEKRERKKGIELIFSKLGEKADEVIKRLVREKGSGAYVVTSDREVARDAERMSVTVIPSEQFRERMTLSSFRGGKDVDQDEEGRQKKKGPSRKLSKKERRRRAVLKKL